MADIPDSAAAAAVPAGAPAGSPHRRGPSRPTPASVLRSTRRALVDPRTVGVAQALPRTAAFLVGRWRHRDLREEAGDAGGGVGETLGLAAQVLLDEVVISAMRNPKLYPHGDDYEKAGADIAAARAMWEAEGWLADPESYHTDPGLPSDASVYSERVTGQRYERLCFESRYSPGAGEPGRERWLAHRPNRTAHAYINRHPGAPRPWLVCIHGFGMGRAPMDLRAFRVQHLHHQLGMNLLLPVLPLHGPRQEPGTDRGEGLMSINLIDSLHGMAQAASDVRAAIRWIQHVQPGAPIGIYGISLGGYVTALTASLEADLSCAIAGIPAVDMPDLFRRHSPPYVKRRALASGALGPATDEVMSVVSPLALAPKVKEGRRYVFAGMGDRLSSSDQARRLWEHWGRGPIAWYPGGHIGFFWTGRVSRFLDQAVYDSGLTSQPPAPLEADLPSPEVPSL